jgi:hypothetical protein
MLAMPLPVAGEHQALVEYLKYQHTAFLAVSHGLTDEQARCNSTVSAFCIASLIKHVTLMQYAWTLPVISEDLPPDNPRSLLGMMADLVNKDAPHEDATIVVPDHLHALFDSPQWTVRWALLHIIEEFARHAGHADIIRESIDGATMYQLLAALDG